MMDGVIDPAVRIANEYIGNFRQIEAGKLYAGAQPELPLGIKYLASPYTPFRYTPFRSVFVPPPFKTVIDLQGQVSTLEEESETCSRFNLAFYSIPLPGLEILSVPPPSKIYAIRQAINDPNLWPIFVHCLHGSDRTGCIVALWRIEHGWTVAEAIEEMREFGNSWIELGCRREVEDFLIKRIK
jgi:hypothetical protein